MVSAGRYLLNLTREILGNPLRRIPDLVYKEIQMANLIDVDARFSRKPICIPGAIDHCQVGCADALQERNNRISAIGD